MSGQDSLIGPQESDSSYTPKASNWYSSLPYAFKANINGSMKIFYLPINPQNLTITTHYATNVISTLYGTVEEHSEQRYFDIVIQGTTGFAPRYVYSSSFSSQPKQYGGRESYSNFIISSFLGGFFGKTLGKLDKAANQAKDVVTTLKSKPANGFEPGVYDDASGYMAFHNLYKFLLDYKKSASKGKNSTERSSTEIVNENILYFVNYKDNNQYSCAVQTFTLERNAQNPMLYNYVIRLRAYNLTSILYSDAAGGAATNRLSTLGLDGGASVFSKAKNILGKSKGVLNSVTGAFSTFGA